jgi:ORF6N domain
MQEYALAIQVERRIYLLRSQKVMLSFDLTKLYGVETKTLNRSVKRNRSRFPPDFMFQLTSTEWESLKYQIGTSNAGSDRRSLRKPSQIVIADRGGIRRALPYAFTEQGVAMLSTVLRSPRAVQVNIAIMRTFLRLREMLAYEQRTRARVKPARAEI